MLPDQALLPYQKKRMLHIEESKRIRKILQVSVIIPRTKTKGKIRFEKDTMTFQVKDE